MHDGPRHNQPGVHRQNGTSMVANGPLKQGYTPRWGRKKKKIYTEFARESVDHFLGSFSSVSFTTDLDVALTITLMDTYTTLTISIIH